MSVGGFISCVIALPLWLVLFALVASMALLVVADRWVRAIEEAFS